MRVRVHNEVRSRVRIPIGVRTRARDKLWAGGGIRVHYKTRVGVRACVASASSFCHAARVRMDSVSSEEGSG